MSEIRPRLLDATPSECILAARQPVDLGTFTDLPEAYPIDGLQHTAPVLPKGAYGAHLLGALIESAAVVEPIGAAAHAACAARPPQREGAILVDPEGPLLGTSPQNAPTPATGWTRELVAWVPAETEEVVSCIDAALARLGPTDRLRIRDPEGVIGLDDATAIAQLPEAHRLTMAVENARGLAVAVAHTLLAHSNGPMVRASLLGIGPRSGLPPLELLVPPDDGARLHGPAERAALVAGIRIPAEHPLWGDRRNEAPEPERLMLQRDATPRWNAATMTWLLRDHLEQWGLEPTAEEVDSLAKALVQRIRPGETPDGPTLYAFVATHLDLARARPNREGPKH